MKKLLALLLLTGTLLACNNHQHAENKNAIETSEADHRQNETVSEKLILNNGAKWKVDSITNSNVENLQAIIKKFNSGTDKSLAAYKKVDDDLQHGLDKMISECKMKGPDHEALHKWLEPLIKQVDKLKQASTDTNAAQLFEAVNTQVNLYNQYFEL
jgi:hypothetical protein